MHILICGRTACGKSSIAKRLVTGYNNNGKNILVLDPLLDPEWKKYGADFVTDDTILFKQVAEMNRSCMLILDESGETIGRYNEELFWLATRSRHYGHISHFITQRPAQLSPTVRDQCSTLFLFACSLKDAKILSDEFGIAEISEAYKLNQFEFFKVPRFGKWEKLTLLQE